METDHQEVCIFVPDSLRYRYYNTIVFLDVPDVHSNHKANIDIRRICIVESEKPG